MHFRNIILGVIGVIGLTGFAKSEKPNILFIFSDDQCFETIGAYGITDIDTPHLDRLAKEGVSFSNTYNMGGWSGAICVASRSCLNTGSFLWRAQAAVNACKAGDRPTWSQMMSAQGYQTYMSGKWHVPLKVPEIFDAHGSIRPGMPNQTKAGYNRPKNEEDYERGWKPWDTQNEGFWKGGTHWSEVLADESIAYLNTVSENGKPFFMYLAFNAPHDPRQAPREYVERYPLDRIEVPESFVPLYADMGPGGVLKGRDENLAPYPRSEYAIKVNRREYYALITHMDDQIGRILDALEDSGEKENTWVIFSSDHGLSVGHHGLVGKQNMYEDALRVPFIVWGPGVEPGTVVDTPIYVQDAMATTLELSGQEVPDFVDYRSVLPLMDGRREKNYDHIYGAYLGIQRMIRRDDWKLIAYPELKKKKLFNLAKDPLEMTDLAGNPEYAPHLERLSALLEETMDELNDPMTSIAAADYPESKKKK